MTERSPTLLAHKLADMVEPCGVVAEVYPAADDNDAIIEFRGDDDRYLGAADVYSAADAAFAMALGSLEPRARGYLNFNRPETFGPLLDALRAEIRRET